MKGRRRKVSAFSRSIASCGNNFERHPRSRTLAPRIARDIGKTSLVRFEPQFDPKLSVVSLSLDLGVM